MRGSCVLRSGRDILRQNCLWPLHSVPPGAFLGPLSGERVLRPHTLDTNQDIFVKTLKNVVFKTCSERPNLPNFQRRILQMLEQTTPSFTYSLSFGVELGYRILTSKEEQTEENLERVRILRGAFELVHSVGGILNDIANNSTVRMGKGAWHTVCSGGIPAAMYDGLFLSHLTIYIVKKFFHDHPNYVDFLYILSEAVRNMAIGQNLDILRQGDRDKSPEMIKMVARYRTGSVKKSQVRLGLILGGVTDEKILQKIGNIFFRVGEAYQAYNDFMGYYCVAEAKGNHEKNSIKQRGTSWICITALQHFTEKQIDLFWKHYGNRNPESQAIIVKMYDDINMPQLFVNEMNSTYKDVEGMMNDLEHKKVAEVCKSYVDWVIGQPIY